jgi:cell fate regulator YaaT (PSP1 superfamily)
MSNSAKVVEVVFKGERRAIYRNRQEFAVNEGELVVVEAERGKELGRVSLVGSLVKLKRGKGEARGIIRKANEEDMKTLEQNKKKEDESFQTCKKKIKDHNLDMKLVDVEAQFDGSKITFYFTASQRIDFRDLVKDLAAVYRTRIELRQIGVRDEAKRLSGYGVCGRKQCCSAFLEEFEQISTQMAKDQQLSLNPTKISGNCGRLLCCLRYEEEVYQNVFKHFPPAGSKVKIGSKEGTIYQISVFKNAALVHYPDKTEEWLDADSIKKGVSNAPVVAPAPAGGLPYGEVARKPTESLPTSA